MVPSSMVPNLQPFKISFSLPRLGSMENLDLDRSPRFVLARGLNSSSSYTVRSSGVRRPLMASFSFTLSAKRDPGKQNNKKQTRTYLSESFSYFSPPFQINLCKFAIAL